MATAGPCANHGSCLDLSLARARAAFEARGLKLTALRLSVFREIAASHYAVGAYDIIEQMSLKGTRLAPVSVYRAIDALMEAGVVHRLESRNAYFACHAAHASERQHIVLSCGVCGTVAEADADPVFAAIDAIAASRAFLPETRIVEIAGRCAHCAAEGGAR